MDQIVIIGAKGGFHGSAHEWDRLCARASGRRRYNAVRHARMIERQSLIMALWREYGGFRSPYGTQARIAAELGVSRPTVHRAIKAVTGCGYLAHA